MRKLILKLAAAVLMLGGLADAARAGGFCTWYSCTESGVTRYYYYDSSYPTYAYDWARKAWRQPNGGNPIISSNGAGIISSNGAGIRLFRLQ